MQRLITFFGATPIIHTLQKAHVIKDFFIYSFGSLFLRAISLFLLPFIMRILTPADYGALALITAFVTIGTAIIGLGLRQLLSIEYFHHDLKGQKQFINDIIIVYSCIALPIVISMWLARNLILNYVFFNAINNATLLAALISLYLFFYSELLYQLMQYTRAAKYLTLLQIVVALIIAINTVWTVWILKWGITGVVWAQASGQIFASIVALYLYVIKQYRNHRNIAASTKKIISYLKYGTPFIPGVVSSWILASSDRWMLGYYYSTTEVGIYSVADLFAQIFNTVILVPWAGSYLPYILKKYKSNEHDITTIEKENQHIMWISMTTLSLLVFFGLIASNRMLLWILPPSYHPALKYVWILLLGQICLLGTYFCSALVQFRKKTFFLAIALLIPAICNLILNYLMINSLGIYGCSLATLLSYCTYFCIVHVYQKKLIKQISN